MKNKALEVHERLLEKFGEPVWRNPLPAIDELVSTFLSQNTNDINRDRAFDSLRAKFSTWEEVRDAPIAEVVEAVRVAGLAKQKGPNIQNALRQISEERGELDLEFLKEMSVEEARAWLVKFRGVGPKTAAIVLLFSLDMPAFPVDTHVYRITGRVGLRPQKISVEKAHPYLEGIFPPETYRTAHLNIIRLGREICKARKPNCAECPLLEICVFRAKKSL
ncbi:MAG TPA: endonuclease III [Anaerolineales bacterium]|nr:endonuclease III [Anaerolineales bacterium]